MNVFGPCQLRGSEATVEGNSRFETTRWSLVLAAGGDSEGAREALAALCQAYWLPLYAYVRRWGHAPEGAADLTQAFFADLLSRNFLRGVDPARGRFRTFLLACCRNFLRKQHRRDAARGPTPISIDIDDAERRCRVEPADCLTPEQIYHRRWALSVLERSLDALRDDYGRSGKATLFEALEPTLAGNPIPGGYAEVAGALGMSEGAVQVAAHRLRRRYQEAIRGLIADTVDDPELVQEELRDLFAALSRPKSRGTL
jgi:RNA polymerase sigma-70 factor (ECF subfamily)